MRCDCCNCYFCKEWNMWKEQKENPNGPQSTLVHPSEMKDGDLGFVVHSKCGGGDLYDGKIVQRVRDHLVFLGESFGNSLPDICTYPLTPLNRYEDFLVKVIDISDLIIYPDHKPLLSKEESGLEEENKRLREALHDAAEALGKAFRRAYNQYNSANGFSHTMESALKKVTKTLKESE